MARGEPRRRWWLPISPGFARRDIAGAIYGLILATSIIAVTREYQPDNAGVTAATVVVTATVFWLAHIYAGVLAHEMHDRHVPTRAEIRRIVDEEWPMVQAGIVPTIVLLLGPLGLLADETAQEVAMFVCLGELAAIGLIAARAAGTRGPATVLSVMITVSFGVGVVVLKAVVH